MTRVKICCIGSVEEARLAVSLGASALGLVSEMPSGPGVIPEALIAEIAATVPPPVGRFLLTSLTDPDEIAAQQRRCGANTLQLCDRVPAGAHAVLRERLPGIAIVQVVHVGDGESVAEAIRIAPEVDALLLDSGNQRLPVKELGGTGRVHDWSLSAEIAPMSARRSGRFSRSESTSAPASAPGERSTSASSPSSWRPSSAKTLIAVAGRIAPLAVADHGRRSRPPFADPAAAGRHGRSTGSSAPCPLCSSAPLLLCPSAPLPLCPLLLRTFVVSPSPNLPRTPCHCRLPFSPTRRSPAHVDRGVTLFQSTFAPGRPAPGIAL